VPDKPQKSTNAASERIADAGSKRFLVSASGAKMMRFFVHWCGRSDASSARAFSVPGILAGERGRGLAAVCPTGGR
jgi:hypothetical protein